MEHSKPFEGTACAIPTIVWFMKFISDLAEIKADAAGISGTFWIWNGINKDGEKEDEHDGFAGMAGQSRLG
jgi:hypothetical protein